MSIKQTWKLLRGWNRVAWVLQIGLLGFAAFAAIQLWFHAPDGLVVLPMIFFAVGLPLVSADGLRRHMMHWVVLDYFDEAERRGCAGEFSSRLAAWVGCSSLDWSKANFSGLNDVLSRAEHARDRAAA